MSVTEQGSAIFRKPASLGDWAAFTTGCQKTKLMHPLITGKIYSTSVKEIFKEKKNTCISLTMLAPLLSIQEEK